MKMKAFRLRKNYLNPTVLFVCFLLNLRQASGQIHPVANQSSIHFTIHNFGFKTGGTLAAPEGDLVFNPNDLGGSSFKMSIKAESINTGNDSRDEHLKEEDYFDVKNHPLIRFVSSSIRSAGGKDNYEAKGTLTIKNTSREISLPFNAVKTGNDWTFAGSFTMNRRDYGVGGSSTISNELTVDIKVVAR
jgi:polyisoprenoid-binding protein YceI